MNDLIHKLRAAIENKGGLGVALVEEVISRLEEFEVMSAPMLATSDLDLELEVGTRRAHLMTQHLRDMGASRAELTVYIQDEKYRVTVEHVPVSPEI